MSTGTNRFGSSHTGSAKDNSSGKTIITGDSGIGKTFLLSTIESEDKRPIFLIPIEEGLKGISPLHHPVCFTDTFGNPIVPATFSDLIDALVAFRETVNVPRPTPQWFDSLQYPIGAIERRVLGELCELWPQWIPSAVLANRLGLQQKEMDSIIARLSEDRRIMVHQNVHVRPQPDKFWKRAHLHLGLDSLSGVEKLIHAEVVGRAGVKSMADKEYNKLWVEAQPLWQEVQTLLDSIRRSTGTHIWLVAHCTEDVDASITTGETYRARDLMFKGSGKTLVEIRQFWRQWADSVWYIMRDVSVQQGTKTKRTTATHRGRVLITAETAQCKAKSRYSIPDRMPATWADIRNALSALQPSPPEKLLERIAALMQSLTQEQCAHIQAEIDRANATPTNRVAALAAILSRVEGMAICSENDRDDGPPSSSNDEKKDAGASLPAPPPSTVGFDGPPEGGM